MLRIGNEVSKSVCIAFAAGCTRNKADTALLFAYFRANGWKIRKRIQDANLVLVATCGFDIRLEKRSVGLLTIADNKRKKGSKLVVIGCLAGINESQIRSNFNVITIPPAELARLDDVIEATVKLRKIQDLNYIDPCIKTAQYCFSLSERSPNTGQKKVSMANIRPHIHSALTFLGIDKTARIAVCKIKRKRSLGYNNKRPWEQWEQIGKLYRLRIARGCLGKCSYCAIRFAIGSLRSKPLDKVLAEFRTALNKGFKEFQLVAGDTGAYGQDIGTNIVDLLRMLFKQKGKFWLTIMDFNPEWLIAYSEKLTELLQQNNHRIRYISMSIQSGSDRILKLMGRKYTALKAKECLYRLRQEYPKIFLNTHVIVGFPTETDDDFEDTIKLLREVRFGGIEIFPYSDRPKTTASQMEDKVSEITIKKRIGRLVNEFPMSSYGI